MFEMFSKLAEILVGLLDGVRRRREIGKDAVLAQWLFGVVDQLLDVCVRGERILGELDAWLNGQGVDGHLPELLRSQSVAVELLRRDLDASRALLGSVSANAFLTLAPLVDEKSGLLSRWAQQVTQAVHSSTAVFFLPGDVLESVLRLASESDAFDGDRIEYVVVLGQCIREAKSQEVRDLRSVAATEHQRLEADVRAARERLQKTRECCVAMVSDLEQSIGSEPVAVFRRKLIAQLPDRKP
ncbi:hypothetical protein [Stackebrandtia soli]|uniref:hypothetical protein n=1 Tax=Stackebrandtia soli TaxID=1892856 RepID=UPI0039E9D668